MRIGITDNHRPRHFFENYVRWLHRIDSTIDVVKLGYTLDNASEVDNLDGLVLTGGGDVHPRFYGKPAAVAVTTEVNELRDAFEFDVVARALERDLPILGICRGMQIMNVFLGGTLIPDLEGAGYVSHFVSNGTEHRHAVQPVPGSLLDAIVGPGPHTVNSIHHQAIDRLGRGLWVSARSPDGVIEAAEWILKDRMPFLLLVQWHPERSKDIHDPCAEKIAIQFLNEVRLITSNNQNI
jgi:putative glutamine amidotransferase